MCTSNPVEKPSVFHLPALQHNPLVQTPCRPLENATASMAGGITKGFTPWCSDRNKANCCHLSTQRNLFTAKLKISIEFTEETIEVNAIECADSIIN